MKARQPPPAAQGDQEVAALIETLHRTSQRLEALTAGELAAVADRDGRAFLLRHGDATRPAAILNALAAPIALLDRQGRVVSVNAAWQRFGADNALQLPMAGVGLNYLEICSQDGAVEAVALADGVRAVLAGAVASFSAEYPCHLPAQQRWFAVNVTPLPGSPPTGVVVMHVDTTAAKHGQEALRRFSTAMDALPDAIFLIDRDAMRVIHVNDMACRLEQQTHAELLVREPWTLFARSRAELEHIYDALITSGEAAEPLELPHRARDGSPGWIELRRHAQRTGERWTLVTLVRDITERKKAEARIVYLNRVYAMLSGINTLIVRVHDRDELFREACRIAVEAGGFRLAVICMVDRTAMRIVPVASAGKSDALLSAVEGLLSSPETAANTLLARALREKKTLLSNDSPHDTAVLLTPQYVACGVRAIAVLPLLVSGESVGALALYAGESAFFQDDELTLLSEMAGDIAFAIDNIAKQERLHYLAYYDVLTGLANQSLFLERVAQSMRGAARTGSRLAIFLIDLERFKNINDSLGHAAGDALLRQVAEWFTRQMGDANLLARLGSDHYAALLPVVKHDGEVERLVDATIKAFLEQPFRLNDAVFRISVKVGVALFPDDGADAESLFLHAEAALKKAKARGERYLFHTQAMTVSIVDKLSLENRLRQALDLGQFVLYYQPKVNLVSGKMSSVEALLRWNDPQSGLVAPGQFIPILEETGLIHDVGRWALHQAVADLGCGGPGQSQTAAGFAPADRCRPGRGP